MNMTSTSVKPGRKYCPMDMVLLGQSRTYTYPNRQRASTLWYHDHAMDRTGENINRGLAGFYIIEALPKGFLLNTNEPAPDAQLIRFDVVKRESDDSAIPPRLCEAVFYCGQGM
jgi:hypothetical protein